MKLFPTALIATGLVHTGSIQEHVSAEVIVVNPSNIGSDLNATCNADNNNVPKTAIKQGNNGDTDQLNLGMYYLACQAVADIMKHFSDISLKHLTEPLMTLCSSKKVKLSWA